jgi:hypothetical protein
MFKVQKDDYHNGFQIMFENGWTVSVQFSWCNYCSNQHKKHHEIYSSSDAEIAAWDEQGAWYRFDNDTVKGWCKPDEVADFMSKVKAF